jgi:hypothetical protein
VVDVVDDEGVVVVMLIGLGAGLVGGCIMGNFGWVGVVRVSDDIFFWASEGFGCCCCC